MKFIVLSLSVFLIFGLSYFLDSSSIPEIEVAKEIDFEKGQEITVPNFSFKTLKAKNISIESFKGKTIILNFWASWCGPCEEEFPAMAKIVANTKNTVLIAISSDENEKDMHKFLSRLKKKVPELKNNNIYFSHDKKKEVSSELFNVVRLPETFIISPSFKIIKKVIGSQYWIDGTMKEYISKITP